MMRRTPAMSLRWFPLFFVLVLLCGCHSGSGYRIIGESRIDNLDGRKLYLKRYADETLVNIDSTTVHHGHFEFSGKLDSTLFAHLFVDNESLMPLVLEEGEIHLDFSPEEQRLSGTPLNDSLYSFIRQKGVMDGLLSDIPHRESALIMEGYDHDEIVRMLSAETLRIQQITERLVAKFIKANYRNVLGPGIFMIMTSAYDFPLMTPEIEAIVLGAPQSFLDDPYVSLYVRMARENTEKMKSQSTDD